MSDLRGDNVIDSRDVIARIEELESVQEDDNFLEDEAEELKVLKEFAAQGENASPDWTFGATLIHDSYFEEYAREFAEEIGAMPNTDSWPGYCIDWAQAAEELQVDYTPVDFDGETYWVR